MKKYYYLMAGLLCASYLPAQTVSDLMKHRELVSGAAPTAHNAVSELMDRHGGSQRKPDPIITAVPLNQSRVKALQADTALLIRITHEEDGAVTAVSKYEYDEFGLLKCVLTGTSEDGLEQQLRYTYTIGKFNYWTSCTKEVKEEDGWRVERKKERTYNDAGQLVETREYLRIDDQLCLFNSHQYDYAHPVVGADGQETYGVCTGNQHYSPSGEVEYSEVYAWFDYLKQYIQTEKIDRSVREKVITHIGEDTVSITRYVDNDVFDKESVYYYGNRVGSYTKEYHEEFDEWIGGSYLEKSDEVIEPGYQTMHYYVKSDRGDRLAAEIIYKGGNPFRPQNLYETIDIFHPYSILIEKGVDVKAKCKDYSLVDGTVTYQKSYDLTWLADDILKESLTYSDGSGFVKNKVYDDSCHHVGDVFFNADSSYVCTEPLSDTYRMFSPDHQMVCQFSPMVLSYPSNANGTVPVDHISFSEEPSSQKPRHLLAPYFDDWWGDRQVVYDLDDQYRVSSVKVSPLGIDSVLNEEIYYEYLDNGIHIKNVHHNNYADSPGIGIVEDVKKSIDNEDGTGCYEWSHYVEGELVDGERKVLTPDSLITSYKYDAETDSLVEDWVSCQDRVTKDSLNITTRVERSVVDGQIQNRHKEERYKDEHHQYFASYDWDVFFERWVGEEKYYRGTAFLNLDINNNLDPVEDYDDTSRYPAVPQGEIRADRLYQNMVFKNHIDYAWDGAKEDWKMTDEELYLVDSLQNEVVVTHKYTYYHGILCERVYTLNVADNHNLERYEVVARDNNTETGEEEFYDHRKVYFQFDGNNRLSERKEEKYDRKGELEYVHVDTYEYGDFTLSPTAIDEIVGKTSLTVHGRCIAVGQGASVTVYDSAGRICAEGKNQVSVPRPGNYVVLTQGKTIKVNIQ